MDSRSKTAVLIRVEGSANGDVTQTHTLWEGTTSSRITTPVIKDEFVFYFSESCAFCQELKTGKFVFEERLPLPPGVDKRQRISLASYASPVIAGDNIFFLTRSGYCYIVQAAPEFKVLKINSINEQKAEFNATPAISENQIFIRSNRYLYCFGKCNVSD